MFFVILSSCSKQIIPSAEKKASQTKFVTVKESGFIYNEAPFPECHASSIVDLENGSFMATWFGGTEEKHDDVTIWTSTYESGKWQNIKQVADGIQNKDLRYPCWNPVLFKHSTGTLFLFFKVGPNPREWWGEMIQSEDNGTTWSQAQRLPAGQLGPIRAKPIELESGTILCPSSAESLDGKWTIHMEQFDPKENHWTLNPIDHDSKFNAIQPTILQHSKSTLQIMCRSRENRIVESWSEDAGQTWSNLAATSLPNPSAGIDAVTLPDGRHVLVYNPTEDGKNDRAKLNVAISKDGKNWTDIYLLENEPKGEFSYPAIIQLGNGSLHVSYTWNRKRIKHVVLQLI